MSYSRSFVTDFAINGYVKIPKFFDAVEVTRITTAIERYIADVVPSLSDDQVVFDSDGRSIRNLWYLQHHDSFFEELAARPDIVGLAETLLQAPVSLMQVETFNKPANCGTPSPAHQDNAYLWRVPPHALTLWCAIDDANESNGALFYFPGSHTRNLKSIYSGVAGNSMCIDHLEFREEESVVVPASSGDVIAHHCLTVHGSGPNGSAKQRRALLLVYTATHTYVDDDLYRHYNAIQVRNGLLSAPRTGHGTGNQKTLRLKLRSHSQD